MAALFLRDMRLAVRVGGGAPIGVVFFLMVVTLVPFAIGPDLALLGRIGPAILWLGALLATLLGLDRLLTTDFEDGSLDLILIAPISLELAIATKALAHWLTTGLPSIETTPCTKVDALVMKASRAESASSTENVRCSTRSCLIGNSLSAPAIARLALSSRSATEWRAGNPATGSATPATTPRQNS